MTEAVVSAEWGATTTVLGSWGSEPDFLTPSAFGNLKFFLCWAQVSWGLRWADCSLLTRVSMKHRLSPGPPSPFWSLTDHCDAQQGRKGGGLTLNIAVFKGYNNTFLAFLLITCWLLFHRSFSGCFFFRCVFFSWAHVFSNSGKITTSILSCPDCMKKSLIALFICSAHERLQNSWLDLKLLMTFYLNRKGKATAWTGWHLIALPPAVDGTGLRGATWTVAITEQLLADGLLCFVFSLSRAAGKQTGFTYWYAKVA